MVEYKLTQQQKRLLLEKVLDECFACIDDCDEEGICSKCGMAIEAHPHRTFLTFDDMHRLRAALGEKGLWPSFYMYALETLNCHNKRKFYIEFMAYLDSDINRHNCLVAQFMEARQ